jgi:RNA ligase
LRLLSSDQDPPFRIVERHTFYTKHLYDYQKPNPDQKHYTKHANNPRAFLESLAAQNRVNAEGFVVRFESGLRVKVKFEDYVRLHRIIGGLNPMRIWDCLRNKDDIETMIDGVPDEIYDEVMDTVRELNQKFADEWYTVHDIFANRPQADNRGDIARYFLASGANTAALFNLLDGKNDRVAEAIWKSLKPASAVDDDELVHGE